MNATAASDCVEASVVMDCGGPQMDGECVNALGR